MNLNSSMFASRSAFVTAIPFLRSTAVVPRDGRLYRLRPEQPRRYRSRVVVVARQSADAVPSTPRRPLRSGLPTFATSRRIVFAGMSGMYALYVLLRATYTYVSPVMAKSLGLSINQVGLIASAFPLLYGFSRLLTGILADRVSPVHALGCGLLLAGIVNVLMSGASSPALLAALWGLNGLVQGVGAGASAKLLTAWHSRTERGAAWSLWSSSANLGAFLAPILCGWLATTRIGYRAGLLIPGLIATMYAILVTPALRDSPADAGHVAPWAGEDGTGESAENEGGSTVRADGEDRTFREVLVQDVLKNWRVWALALSYFFLYFTRQGMRSWLQFFMVESRGMSAATAAYRISGMEVGGIIGTFSAGYLSDAVDGRRVAVTIGFLVGLGLSLIAAAFLPAGAGVAADIAVIALIGGFINGPQCLIGLIGAEVAPLRVVATVSGVLGWVSYSGATAAGLPLAWVVKTYGWKTFWGAMIVSTVAATLLLLPMIGLKGRAPPELKKLGQKKRT